MPTPVPRYEMVYRCSECGWSTNRYSSIDPHEDQLEPGHLVTGQLERVEDAGE